MTQLAQQAARLAGVVVACRHPDGRWLLIRRSATVRVPLRVCFPGGWIDAGESQADAVRREMREELNADDEAVHYPDVLPHTDTFLAELLRALD